MDLKDLTPKSDVVVVTVKHPMNESVLKNDDKSDMTITVFAPHTKEYKTVFHEIANKRIKKAQGKKEADFSLEEIEEMTLDVLAKTTKEWNITFGGEKPELNITKAKEIYSQVFWIKAQIEEATNNYLDFMKA